MVGEKVDGQILFGARSEKPKILFGAKGEKRKNLFGAKWKILFGSQRLRLFLKVSVSIVTVMCGVKFFQAAEPAWAKALSPNLWWMTSSS